MVLIEVICPCALTVKVGIDVAEPYVPALTPVFEIAIVTGVEPLNDVPERPVPIVRADVVLALTVVEPPKLTEFPLMVMLLLVRPLLGMVALIWLGAMLIEVLLAAVNWPWALTV